MTTKTPNASAEPTYTVKCMFFFKRNPNLTAEECWAHWRDVHAGLCVPWLTSHKFLNYQQVELQGKISPTGEKHARTIQDFDGIAVFEAPSMEALGAAFGDPFWADVVAKDVGNFTDQNGLFENGIVAQYTGRMTTPVLNGKGTADFDAGWKAWNAYHAAAKGEKTS